MKNFRIEYYDEKTNSMKVIFVDAEDTNEILKDPKYKNFKSKAICETKVYKEMLEKYSDIMRPLK